MALTQSNGKTEFQRDLLNKSARDDDSRSSDKRAQIRSEPQTLLTSNILGRSKTSEGVVWMESRKILELYRCSYLAPQRLTARKTLMSSVVNTELTNRNINAATSLEQYSVLVEKRVNEASFWFLEITSVRM